MIRTNPFDDDKLKEELSKMTGKEIWRALPTDSEQGYSQPVIVEAGGIRQLIIWHPTAVASLDPATGKVYWSVPFPDPGWQTGPGRTGTAGGWATRAARLVRRLAGAAAK